MAWWIYIETYVIVSHVPGRHFTSFPMSYRLSFAPTAARFCALLLMSGSVIPGNSAQAEIPPVSSASAVADGHPWNMTMVSDGRKRRMILLPDGTGKMEGGLMTMKATWRATAEGLCLKPSIVTMSERCVTLIVRPGGYDALENGKLWFELRR
jgi:hypothetical protein